MQMIVNFEVPESIFYKSPVLHRTEHLGVREADTWAITAINTMASRFVNSSVAQTKSIVDQRNSHFNSEVSRPKKIIKRPLSTINFSLVCPTRRIGISYRTIELHQGLPNYPDSFERKKHYHGKWKRRLGKVYIYISVVNRAER